MLVRIALPARSPGQALWGLVGLLGLLVASELHAQPAGGPANSPSCEPVRSRIEANIRSKGIADAQVTVHESGERPGGQRVGDCEGGRKLMWYSRGGPASSPAAGTLARTTSAPAAAAGSAAPKRDQPILTECADGSVQYGGSCKRR